MQIPFKKKRLRAHLILGLIWMALGILSLVTVDTLRWTNYGYAVIGLLYLVQYWHDRTRQYLTIENGVLRKNGFFGFGRKIKLEDIYWIKKFAGDYTLKTLQGDLKIDTDLIDENSLADLNSILGELDLPPEKTPFTNQAATR